MGNTGPYPVASDKGRISPTEFKRIVQSLPDDSDEYRAAVRSGVPQSTVQEVKELLYEVAKKGRKEGWQEIVDAARNAQVVQEKEDGLRMPRNIDKLMYLSHLMRALREHHKFTIDAGMNPVRRKPFPEFLNDLSENLAGWHRLELVAHPLHYLWRTERDYFTAEAAVLCMGLYVVQEGIHDGLLKASGGKKYFGLEEVISRV